MFGWYTDFILAGANALRAAVLTGGTFFCSSTLLWFANRRVCDNVAFSSGSQVHWFLSDVSIAFELLQS